MRQITFKEYRNIDLAILAAITFVFEVIATLAAAKWFPAQPIAFSITVAMICVVMMRWSGYAAIHAAVGGFAFCAASGATIEQVLVYCIGNVFALGALLLIRLWGKEELRKDPFKRSMFAVTAYMGAVLGRWLVSLLFGGDLTALVVYATTDIISLLFALIVLNLLAKSDGMIEDQKTYLLRLQREKEEMMN
ncbi:MAG: hypothetical protein IKV65_03475 [Erysipelotrichaceae bacterium]|nr:hypothetical protein [Erysipelotrichaceae bacterium]